MRERERERERERKERGRNRKSDCLPLCVRKEMEVFVYLLGGEACISTNHLVLPNQLFVSFSFSSLTAALDRSSE